MPLDLTRAKTEILGPGDRLLGYRQRGQDYFCDGSPRYPAPAPTAAEPPRPNDARFAMPEGGLPSLIGAGNIMRMMELAAQAPAEGCIVEVGVYQGGSAMALYQQTFIRGAGQKLWLYDTFSGIPYADPQIDSHTVGDFNDTSLAQLQEALPLAEFRPGIFPDTLDPAMGPVAFVHLDVDQYRSYREAILALRPLLLPGAIMVFDDYHALAGAKRAIDEMLGAALVIEEARVHYIHRA